MSKPGKGSTHRIAMTLPIGIATAIRERANDLDWTESLYATKIVEKWFSDGCPGVSKADHALLVLNENKAPYNNTKR